MKLIPMQTRLMETVVSEVGICGCIYTVYVYSYHYKKFRQRPEGLHEQNEIWCNGIVSGTGK